MPRPSLHHVMQNLITLTQVRDSLALDSAILSLLFEGMRVLGCAKPDQIGMVRLREVVNKIKSNELNHASILAQLDDAACQQLCHILHHAESTHQWLSSGGKQWLVLPLRQNICHRHAAILVQTDQIVDDAMALLEQAMVMFHHFASLISENERDALTGLLNRKTFDHSVSRMLLANAQAEHQQHFYLAIFDIDFFKRINDTHGHLIGDEVLLRLSQLMTETFREHDLLFRFGGEEFVGVFACHFEGEILVALERFRKVLANFRFPQVGNVTVSIGCAKMALDVLPNVVIERADEALYYAKEHGRNQIRSYEQLLSDGVLQDSQIEGEVELF